MLSTRIAGDLVGRCRSLGRAIGELERELATLTVRIAPALLELPGCGALTAAKLLSEIGPIDRFQTDAQLARYGGVAPLEASSGCTRRHRLDRGGNRQLNCALHRIAVTQARYAPARARLPRTQTGRGQEPARGDPLPQTTTRTRRLQHPENKPRLDIGATLAHDSGQSPGLIAAFRTTSRCYRGWVALETMLEQPQTSRAGIWSPQLLRDELVHDV